MKAQAQWIFGNFRPTVVAEITTEQLEKMASMAMKQVLQRKPASDVEKTLAGYTKRPKGFERASIEYSAERAKVVKKGFTLELNLGDEDEPDVINFVCENVDEHIPGQNGEYKWTKETACLERHESADDIEEFLTNDFVMIPGTEIKIPTEGYDGPTHTEEGEFHPDALANAKIKRDAVQKVVDGM